ncbi:hypothetical protein PAPYR_1381 [Paratrimastix pyriformis]|uniref:TRAF-type domain-containing protein n=1 Tax=Paratrimastix pyriformis TaxID=342808 RepID=A0ABQ8UZG3_9EUKA|nr:hypothetical protein PAPYR_1381 [Paratrimastix pyriformis]
MQQQVFPAQPLQRLADGLQCHCPNRGLDCPVAVAVQAVEQHLLSGCEWREEECDQFHQQVRRPEMARHKDTCPAKPMACGSADVGCPTRCQQGDLAAHERDGVVAHVGLLRQRLADTSAGLTHTKAQLADSRSEVTQCKADLAQTRSALAQTSESRAAQGDMAAALKQTQNDLAAVRSQIDQLFLPLATPEGLEARWDEAAREVAIDWRKPRGRVPPRVGDGGDLSRSAVVYMGPDCRCRYRFPPGIDGRAGVRFVVVAVRGLAESGPSAPATCSRPAAVFRYDHDMDERGLFYYIGTQGRTQPWQNPAKAGWVTATRSSDGPMGGAPSDALGRQPCNSYTSAHPNSWWQVDLGAGRLFTPTHYTVRSTPRPIWAPNGGHSLDLSGLEMYGSLDEQ